MLMRAQAVQRQEWLQARKAGIGATDAAVILGLSKWKSPLQLYAEKRGLVDEDASENEAMEWGLRLEPVIAAKYEEETGRATYDPGPFEIHRSPDVPFMFATLDRLITGSTDDRPLPFDSPGVLELKTASAWARDEWFREPPPIYQVQVQHQLACTGHLWGSIAVLIGGRTFVWQDVERNDRFIERLLALEADFWQRVQRGDPPPPDGSAGTTDVLARLFPREEHDDAITLPAEAVDWDRKREVAVNAIDQAETQKREAENYIKAAIGSHAIGMLPNGVRYAWKTEKRKAYSVEASESRRLRRSEARA